MNRREFIAGLGSVTACPMVARAQQAKVPVIGFVNSESLEGQGRRERLAVFHKGLAETGYIEGRNVAIEYRWAEGHYDRLPGLTSELVRRQVAAIIANTTLGVRAAKAETQTIPILFVTGTDPVETGLVASLARPGGNVTGASILTTDVIAKRLQLLHELVPAATWIAFLVNPTNPIGTSADMRELQIAARALSLHLLILNASSPSEIDAAFAVLVEQLAGALFVNSDTFYLTQRDQIVALATQHAVPAIYVEREFAAAGGLICYGTPALDAWRQVGIYAGRILKGEKPADLPVMLPTKLELVINLKTATALGLTIPETLRATADEVIQ
jgi:putative tryptophan/tyrosine transport system substrate-binding protein